MSKSMIPAQRRRQIIEYLELHQVARSSLLSEMLQASEATIRRDLDWLEQHGILERTHGGAILTQRMQTEAIYSTSAESHRAEKGWIGQAAAAQVENGDTVFLNNGTTATQVILALQNRSDLEEITVITNNVSAAISARQANFEIVLLGGSLRPRSNSLVGRFATHTLRQIYASKTILGVDGISIKYGCTTPISAEAEITRLMIERSFGPIIIVADHSKWGVVSHYDLATIDQIDKLITDPQLPNDSHIALCELGVNLIIASSELALPSDLS
jgi:DeoR/GlpR family transcriptional regulator of sugar metabolism